MRDQEVLLYDEDSKRKDNESTFSLLVGCASLFGSHISRIRKTD
jgi:hypothetical protein